MRCTVYKNEAIKKYICKQEYWHDDDEFRRGDDPYRVVEKELEGSCTKDNIGSIIYEGCSTCNKRKNLQPTIVKSQPKDDDFWHRFGTRSGTKWHQKNGGKGGYSIMT